MDKVKFAIYWPSYEDPTSYAGDHVHENLWLVQEWPESMVEKGGLLPIFMVQDVRVSKETLASSF